MLVAKTIKLKTEKRIRFWLHHHSLGSLFEGWRVTAIDADHGVFRRPGDNRPAVRLLPVTVQLEKFTPHPDPDSFQRLHDFADQDPFVRTAQLMRKARYDKKRRAYEARRVPPVIIEDRKPIFIVDNTSGTYAENGDRCVVNYVDPERPFCNCGGTSRWPCRHMLVVHQKHYPEVYLARNGVQLFPQALGP